MIFCFADFEFDDERLELRRAGRVIKTEAVALRLLAALVERAGEVVTKDELIEDVWEGRAVADNVITVAMARLRKALNTGPDQRDFVLTVYGRGYRFVGPYATRQAPEEIPTASADTERMAPFVGRERILERLEHSLAEARRGHGRVCVLMGEAGIGKTRAVEAFEQKLDGSQVRVCWGFCREAGDTPPLWPWLRLLREVAAASRTHGASLQALLAELSALLDGARAAEVDERAPASLRPASVMRHHSFDLFARAFARAAEEAPWVLVLDDLHRADAASIELLGYLVDEIAHLRIMIVATLRHAPGRRSPRPDTHLPYVLGHRNCDRIALERLRESDVAAYVTALADDVDGELARTVFAKSEGNPFYMTELSRQLTSAETPDARGLIVPDVALDLIRQRVAKLRDDARQVLAAAAVIGRTFELSLLQGVTGRDANELMASLDQAIVEDLVVAAPESTTAFAFGHDLMRAVLYDALAPADQRRWHIRTAEALEKRSQVGDAVPPSELAYHLHAALPESDLRKTVAYCRRASAAAAAVYSHSDVVRYLLHALEALQLLERPSVRLRISMWYVITLYSLGEPRGIRALGEVVRLARDHGHTQMLARAAILLNPYPGLKPIAGARAALEQALQGLGPDELALRAVTLAALACTAPYCYSATRSDELSDEAMLVARKSGGRAARYVALVAKLYVRGGALFESEADRAADELTALHGPHPEPPMAVAPLYVGLYRALSTLSRGQIDDMTLAIDSALNHARSIRHLLAWHFRRFQALIEINRGALAKGIPILVTLQRNAQQHSLLWTDPFCAFDRVVVFREIAEGALVFDDALRSALDYDPTDPPAIWSMKVRAQATAGLDEDARAALRSVAPAELAALPCDNQYLGTLGHLAHAAARLAERPYIDALLPLLARFPDRFTAHMSFLSDAVPQLLALLESARGNHAEAVAHAEAAVTMNDRIGFVRSATEARLQLAGALLERGKSKDREPALTLARDAQRTAARLGMRLLARTATLLLKANQAK